MDTALIRDARDKAQRAANLLEEAALRHGVQHAPTGRLWEAKMLLEDAANTCDVLYRDEVQA